MGAREARALDPSRDRLVRGRRSLRRMHPTPRASSLARTCACDAAAPQSALDVHRVAVVLHARAPRHDLLRDRGCPSPSNRSMGGDGVARSAAARSRVDPRLGRWHGDRRRVDRDLRRVVGLRHCAPPAGPYAAHARTTSCTVFGIPSVRTSEPDAVTRTSSSMRMPIPRHSGETVGSSGAT